ncbi:MAG: tetratricopeptide repeat protein, partial [Calditrichia bacterium]
MKKLLSISLLLLITAVLLVTGCRPPEIEGVVVNMQHGLYDKAFELAQEAVQKYPDNAEAWYLLGSLYGRQENFEQMNEAFDKSLSISQEFAAEIEQARYEYFAENYNDALKNYYNKALTSQDEAEQKKLFQQAADKFVLATQANPARTEPYTPMATAFLRIGDTASAETYLIKAVDAQPENDTLVVAVGDFYYRANRLEKAIENYKKALNINPDNTLAHISLGEIYAKQENWQQAITHFDKAMELEPDNPDIPRNISIIYFNDSQYEEAIPYLKKTLELNPDDKDMYELLSISYLQRAQKFQQQYNENEDP